MSLARFSRAAATPGYLYELAHGVIEVTHIPGLPHGVCVRRISRAFAVYEERNPDIVIFAGGGAEAKIELWGSHTERHPDFSVYLSAPPEDTDQPWDRWTPDIVIEVVSASSQKRDDGQKRADYLAAGVREYWIIDPLRRVGVFLTRRGDSWIETTIGPRGKWRTTPAPRLYT